ncbi:hypothetical protein JQ621_00305 [Bradyrhizobium manausense]|uniref:hypothetical protein n=1 Tax=Bradyrhizobium manausense TaxID=989370 RepID=UPI001BA43D76|nr:hypothetical protein [Bradyrhizobium manausense]MBR1085914.1 hypothetical protein [Bradyrhizobium manausense]
MAVDICGPPFSVSLLDLASSPKIIESQPRSIRDDQNEALRLVKELSHFKNACANPRGG